MRQIILTGMLVLCARYAYGTAQEPERLIHNGTTNQMHSTPLEAYFTTNNPRPAVWQQVQQNNFDSGCWRCYIGTWAIRDGHLFLDNLEFCQASRRVGLGRQVVQNGVTNHYTSPLALLLPDQTLPRKADWFSGVIRLPQGKELQYVHMGFGSVYERDHFIKIENGKVVAEKTVENLDNHRLYTSDADLQWQEIGNMTAGGGLLTDDPFAAPPAHTEDGNWHDARMIRTTNFVPIVAAGNPFTTRGILVRHADDLFGDRFALFIPPSALTPPDELPLAEIPAAPKIANGSHVEIVAKFIKTKEAHALSVLSIRQLKHSESIHRKDYRLPHQVPEDAARKLTDPGYGR